MKRLYFLYFLFLIFSFGCESKKENQVSHENNQSALDVKVGKVGVIINIDSLVYINDTKNSNLEISKILDSTVTNLKAMMPIQTIVTDKTLKILKDNNYNFQLVNNYNIQDFPKEQISKATDKIIDFNKLKQNYNYDDLLLINVKVGLDQDSLKKDLTAKTYITLNILDLNNKTIKYSESIGGSKYLALNEKKIIPNDVTTLIQESINETLNIIDNKY